MAEPEEDAQVAPAPAAAAEEPRNARFDRLRKAGDRVPTRWFAAIGTGLFLAATAAFGGLMDATADPIPQIDPDDTHTNGQLRLSAERAMLFDEFPETGVTVKPGERVVAVVVEVENVWTEALPTSRGFTVSDALRLDALPDTAPGGVARYDDGTLTPWLQPGVPVTVVVAWAVPARRFEDADEIALRFYDETLQTGELITYGQSWEAPVLAATVRVPLRDSDATEATE